MPATVRHLVLLTCAGLLAPVHAETLWQLGTPDDDYREFAIAGQYNQYPGTFPQDVTFRVGASVPERDWPFLQPGPADAWAGMREHPFRLEFDLAAVPESACQLTLDFVNTHWGQPPTLEVDLNGEASYRFQTPKGADDKSLTDASAGKEFVLALPFPSKHLRAGTNRITLTLVAGSWVLFDAVKLESGKHLPTEPVIASVTAQCTPLFRRSHGKVKQVIQVTVNNTGIEGEAHVHLQRTIEELRTSRGPQPSSGLPSAAGQAGPAARVVSLAPGTNVSYVLVAPLSQTERMVLVLRVGEREHRAEFPGRPERQWKVFVAASAHTDIGYTDWQERTFDRHNENTARAIQACEEHPGFKWNLEVAHQAYLFRGPWGRPYWTARREVGPENPALLRGDMAALVKLAREGRLGIGGLYLNMLTGLCSGEELVRVLTRGQRLGETYGLRIESAHLNDVPSAVGTLPMLMRQAGVRYFSDAVNQTRGPVFNGAPREIHQAPFWWEGLDGSRVLAIFTGGYAQAGGLGLMGTVDTVAQRLPGWLKGYDRDDYPADAVLVYGGVSDNQPLDTRYAEVVAEWNAQWEYPKIIVARNDEFFRYIEASFGKQLPVHRGDMGSYWEDGAGSSAQETAMVRLARTRLESAERWHALARAHDPGHSFPVGDFDRAWEQVLFYDEHTWGAHCSISQPESEQTKHQWEVKAAFATRAHWQSLSRLGAANGARHRLLRSSAPSWRPVWRSRTDYIDSHFPYWTGRSPLSDGTGRGVISWNDQPWPRDVLVAAKVPEGEKTVRVRDERTGRLVPAQRSADRLLFLARDVPPCGYACLNLQSYPAPPTPPVLRQADDEWSWATHRFVLRLDRATGSLVGLRDRRAEREWVNSDSGYGLDQFLYVLGGNDTGLIDWNRPAPDELSVRTHTSASVRLLENGPVRAVLEIKRQGDGLPPVDSYMVLLCTGRLDFVNVIHKEATTEKEAGYFAFPFRLEKLAAAKAFVELPYGIVQVEKEQMPGGCREWYSANTFAALSDGRATACLATPHAPLLTVNDLFRGKWNQHHETTNGTLFSYAFNNYWFTNYKASQGGDLVFAYSLQLTEGDFDPVAATRFGWEVMGDTPPVGDEHAVWDTAVHTSPSYQLPEPAEGSLLRVTSGQALIGGATWRDDRLLVRLYNPSHRATRSTLSLPHVRIRDARRTDLIGRNGQPLAVRGAGHQVTVPVPQRGIATVVLRVQ